MKTVIHVWTHEFNINPVHLAKYNYYNEKEFYFGLGDLMRSTIKLYELSKIMNFRLIVDLQLHPISSFLKIKKTEYSDYVLENKNNVDYVCYGGVEDYINESTKDVLLILTNDFFSGTVTNDCKAFMKSILDPTTEYQEYINFQLSKLPFHNYNIIHYRLNDDEFKNGGVGKNTEYLNSILYSLNNNKESNDVLLTDSISFKEHSFLNSDVYIFDTKVCHLGLSKDYHAIRDTLFELFLITRSSKIKTYCKIHSVSGFVKWISEIYDIPIQIISC
jgi:hypothetical protein